MSGADHRAAPDHRGNGHALATAGDDRPGAAGPPDADRAGLLEQVRQVAVDLLGATGRPPARLRVRAADVDVELTWADAPADPAPAPAAARPPAAEAPAAGTHLVRAPSPGTFHRSPAPGAEPFAAVGDVVRAGQQVAILEAMKLMLPVEADRAGRVAEVLAADGQSVEFGEPLLALAPDGG